MTPQTFSVSVLLQMDADAWVAQCIEHDVAAQGCTADEARQRFMTTLVHQILLDMAAGTPPLVHLNPPPDARFRLSKSWGPISGQHTAYAVPVTKEHDTVVLVTPRGVVRGTATATFLAAA
jgi:hypothetical protein